jgi:hypothetical protein
MVICVERRTGMPGKVQGRRAEHSPVPAPRAARSRRAKTARQGRATRKGSRGAGERDGDRPAAVAAQRAGAPPVSAARAGEEARATASGRNRRTKRRHCPASPRVAATAAARAREAAAAAPSNAPALLPDYPRADSRGDHPATARRRRTAPPAADAAPELVANCRHAVKGAEPRPVAEQAFLDRRSEARHRGAGSARPGGIDRARVGAYPPDRAARDRNRHPPPIARNRIAKPASALPANGSVAFACGEAASAPPGRGWAARPARGGEGGERRNCRTTPRRYHRARGEGVFAGETAAGATPHVGRASRGGHRPTTASRPVTRAPAPGRPAAALGASGPPLRARPVHPAIARHCRPAPAQPRACPMPAACCP